MDKGVGALTYRPEVDGLRAIAVGTVVLFHAGFGCPGGYVGVDVFFVISGFLITSLIVKDLATDRPFFRRFWERRARRIVPAMAVVTLATLAAGWLWLMPKDFRDLGRAAASQAVFSANFEYWRDSGYFARGADEKPLLHTWSLAVEEQFYLVAPVVLWALSRSRLWRSRQAMGWTVGAGLLASLGLSVWAVARHPDAAFYLLPTRAWELLVGAALVFLPATPAPLEGRAVREIAAGVGLLLVLAPVFLYSSETPFPGLAALPPCVGTALIIWATGSRRESPTALARFLSTRPVVFVGLISYSLYLWHWPVLTFGRQLAIAPLTAPQRALLVVLGFLLAVLSWRFVETPFRSRRWGASPASMFAAAGAMLAAVFVGGALCVAKHGFPGRVPADAIAFAEAADDRSFIAEINEADVRKERLTVLGRKDAEPSLLVWGDSHAMAVLPAFDAFLSERGAGGRAATHSCMAPVLGWRSNEKCSLGAASEAYNEAVLDYVRRHRIRDVVLAARWISHRDQNVAENGAFERALLETVRRLVDAGARPWVLLDVPNHDFDVPKGLARAAISGADLTPLCARPTAEEALDIFDERFVRDVEAAGGRVVDPKPRFLDPSRDHYLVKVGKVVLYRDRHHLTTKGSRLMLVPLLRESLESSTEPGDSAVAP